MTVKDWLHFAKHQISPLDAELILTHLIPAAEDRSWLIAHDDFDISDIINEADAMLAKRASGQPLAQLLGFKEFYGRNFSVNNTLIPRPETENIIDFILELKPLRVIDVGTGSGAIAITAKLESPSTEVYALDLMPAALETARINADNLGASIHFIESNLLSDFQIETNDLIAANLPYVNPEWDWLDKNSLNFEPASALYAEDNGCALIFELIRQIDDKAKYLLLEADPCQHERIVAFAQTRGWKLAEIRGFIICLTR